MQQTILLRRIPCNVRAEGKTLDAYEGIARVGGADAGSFLREASTGK